MLEKVCLEKSLYHWWECKLELPLWRTEWRFLKKLKIELSYDPAVPLLGINSEKTILQEDTHIPAPITIAKVEAT